MKFTKTISCGSKSIKITDDTNVKIRLATNDEKELIAKKYWNVPNDLSCQAEMWKAFCELLNTFESSIFKRSPLDVGRKKIWGKCLKALKITPDGSLEKCQFSFVPKDDTNAENIIQIDILYSNRVEETDEFGFVIRDAEGDIKYKTEYATKTSICEYPSGFERLLETIEQYLAKEMKAPNLLELDKGTIASLFYTQKEKWEKKRKNNKLKILHFVESNLIEIKQFNEYMSGIKHLIKKDDFMTFCTSKQRVLDVDGNLFFEFKNDCGFDLDIKENELKAIILKIAESNNPGERQVDYAIKWFMDVYKGYVVTIKNDCESQYRYNCILLCKPDFRNEVQEFDHILLCSAGVILIETKHWKGKVEIRPDGKWTRKLDAERAFTGVDSPKFQMRRHEVLMQKILPNIPVHSFLCFSNASTIIDGKENFMEYPIITVEQLEETLTNLCVNNIYSKDDIASMVATIEAHKVHKV